MPIPQGPWSVFESKGRGGLGFSMDHSNMKRVKKGLDEITTPQEKSQRLPLPLHSPCTCCGTTARATRVLHQILSFGALILFFFYL